MPFEKILVAIDGSACCDHAFAKALELAAITHAKLTALAVEGLQGPEDAVVHRGCG